MSKTANTNTQNFIKIKEAALWASSYLGKKGYKLKYCLSYQLWQNSQSR